MRPVVYLPTWLSWGVLHERPHYLMETFAAAGHRVFFVDPRAAATRFDGGVAVVPTLASVPASHVILYTHFPKTRDLIERFDDPVVVYDVLDDLSMYDANEEGLPNEQRAAYHHAGLVHDADVVIASNPVLVDKHRHERDDIILVENGVDVVRFSAATRRPRDLPTGVVIGYHGSVHPWFDFDLLGETARKRPDWHFVVVGPVNATVSSDAGRLAALPNVHFMGERPPSTMPAYAQAFDVGVLWRRISDITAAMTPLKLNEYLAAATPVVSTPIPAAEASPGVIIGEDADSMVEAIEEALARREDSAWQTLAATLAADADWSRRIDPLLRRLETTGARWVPED
jgi:glycosyltransferase involved in cell wall biosynthesis